MLSPKSAHDRTIVEYFVSAAGGARCEVRGCEGASWPHAVACWWLQYADTNTLPGYQSAWMLTSGHVFAVIAYRCTWSRRCMCFSVYGHICDWGGLALTQCKLKHFTKRNKMQKLATFLLALGWLFERTRFRGEHLNVLLNASLSKRSWTLRFLCQNACAKAASLCIGATRSE